MTMLMMMMTIMMMKMMMMMTMLLMLLTVVVDEGGRQHGGTLHAELEAFVEVPALQHAAQCVPLRALAVHLLHAVVAAVAVSVRTRLIGLIQDSSKVSFAELLFRRIFVSPNCLFIEFF